MDDDRTTVRVLIGWVDEKIFNPSNNRRTTGMHYNWDE